MSRISLLYCFIAIIVYGCSDPNTIGLEVHPDSDNIIIDKSSTFSWQSSITESEDSIRSDEANNLIVGTLDDPIFSYSSAGFCTQILLAENNIDLGSNPIVDSVVLCYSYSGFYGDLESFTSVSVNQLTASINKDSVYYSSFVPIHDQQNYVSDFFVSMNNENPILRIRLENSIGQQILDLGNSQIINNETFLEHFYGFNIFAEGANTMLYLNPSSSDTYYKIYYHNDSSQNDTLSLDFNLSSDAARVNYFNEKSSMNIIEDTMQLYIQSMAGYKANIIVENRDSLREFLKGKVINRVNIIFDILIDSENEYQAHDKLFLVRVNSDGDNVFLSDYTIQGEAYFGGQKVDNQYTFNVTRYFFQLLNNETYTNELYLLPAGAAINANRTLLNKDIKLEINYSEL